MSRTPPLNAGRSRFRFASERAADPSLDDFLASLERFPTLSREENARLARLAQQGDERTREQLVEGNLRLVVSVASQYAGRGLPLMDIIQEGSIGLLQAIAKYDPERGEFSTYATWWIRRNCDRAVANQASNIRLPLNVHEQRTAVYLANQSAEQDLSDEELAELTSISAKHLKRLRELPTGTTSLERELDAPVGVSRSGEALSLADSIADTAPSLYEQALERERLDTLYRHLRDQLTSQEREIIYQRFGLQHAFREHSLEEIAVDMGLRRREVQRLEASALRKLREAYELLGDEADAS